MDFKQLEKFLDSLTSEEIGVPGVDCVVYHQNKPVFRHMSGYADRDKGVKMSGNELYNLYSTSKVLTCTGAMSLYEKGKFLMNDPLYEYMPEFKDVKVKIKQDNGEYDLVDPKRPIIVQDLFAMSAGFTYNRDSENIKKVIAYTNGKAPTREIAKAIAADNLVYHPGERWEYSLAHDVLGAFIEVVSGKKFGEYLKENIFDVVGMKNTTFERNDNIYSKMASQYMYDSDRKYADEISKENGYCLGSEYESGGAGIISSVDDYGLFAAAMANGGKALNGNRVLKNCTVNLMRQNILDEVRLKDFNWRQFTGYGYGYGVRTYIDKSAGSLGSLGEFGWGGAAGAYVLIDPDREIAVYYAQHMLNNLEPYIHPRIRNFVYTALED